MADILVRILEAKAAEIERAMQQAILVQEILRLL